MRANAFVCDLAQYVHSIRAVRYTRRNRLASRLLGLEGWGRSCVGRVAQRVRALFTPDSQLFHLRSSPLRTNSIPRPSGRIRLISQSTQCAVTTQSSRCTLAERKGDVLIVADSISILERERDLRISHHYKADGGHSTTPNDTIRVPTRLRRPLFQHIYCHAASCERFSRDFQSCCLYSKPKSNMSTKGVERGFHPLG